MVSSPLPRLTLASDVHPLNAPRPPLLVLPLIVFSESGNESDVKNVQSENAPAPISVNDSEKVKVVNFVAFANA